jgi:hypothetical protein
MRKIGKTVGSKVYIHKSYAHLVVGKAEILNAEMIAGITSKDYTCIRYDKKNNDIAFQKSPDFNTADEPTVGKTITVKADGDVRISLPKKNNPQIWHHKWMWVGDNFSGFDVEASKARSELWEPHVSKEEKRKIGYRDFWNLIKERWEK